MRPIKCRGKRLIDGKWIYGVPYLDGGWHIMIDSNTATPEEGTGSWSVDPATIGQFTGLTDKNGAEIYEGDIVVNGLSGTWTIQPLERGSFSLLGMSGRYKDSNYDISALNSNAEVIGNIHDNPQLLKNE